MSFVLKNKDGSVHSTYGSLTDEEQKHVESSTPDAVLEKVGFEEMVKLKREFSRVAEQPSHVDFVPITEQLKGDTGHEMDVKPVRDNPKAETKDEKAAEAEVATLKEKSKSK